MSNGRGGPLRRYFTALAVLAAAAVLAHLSAVPLGPLDLSSALLASAAGLSTAVPIRFLRDGGIEGITVDEAMLVALLFGTTLGQAPLLLAGAVIATHVALRNGLDRVVYNGASVTLAAVAATAVFGMIGTGPSVMSPRSLAAVLGAVLTYNLVTSLSLAELFRRLEGRPYRVSILDTWHVNLLTLTGNAAFGVLLAIVVGVNPMATILAVLLIVGLHLGYRGYAGVVEERSRNERLHDVARTLAEATGSPDARTRFVAQLADLLGGERVDLVVRNRGRSHLLRWTGPGQVDLEVDPRLSDPLLAALRDLTPVRVAVDSSGAAPYRDALAAPLVVGSELVGAVAVYDRRGLEPWDAADLVLLSSLASEAAVAVRNAELVASLREETEKLGDIVEAASDGIVLLGVDGAVRTWSPAMARMTSVASEAAVGAPWHGLLNIGDQGPAVEQTIRAVLEGRCDDASVDLDLVSPARRWLRITASPVVGDEAPEGAVLVVRDVTAVKETEELKADFVATVSHELRTPLTPLKGLLVTAAARWEQLDAHRVRQLFEGMERQVDRLESLVADLLVVADIERGDIAVGAGMVEVPPIVEAVIARAEAVAERLHYVAGGEPTATDSWVLGDEATVRRIVEALVSNGLKHTDGSVWVRIATTGPEVVIEVADEGPGIPAWDRDRIFEKFGRSGDHLTRSQGPGLGLPIAKALTEGLGGRLELHSGPGQGATFRVHLPRPASVVLAS